MGDLSCTWTIVGRKRPPLSRLLTIKTPSAPLTLSPAYAKASAGAAVGRILESSLG